MSTNDAPRLCERCNEPIPPARIKAMPETWICIECSEEVGGEFKLVATQVNLGKAGSMKLNYGGVNVRKKRRAIPRKTD